MKRKDTFKDYIMFICTFLVLWILSAIPDRWFTSIINAFPKVKEKARKMNWPFMVFLLMAFWFITKFSMAF